MQCSITHALHYYTNFLDLCIMCSVCILEFYTQEGENNDKFFTHPRNPKALAAYLFAHNHVFYMMELLTGLLLMMLSLCEAPAVPSLRLDVYVSWQICTNTLSQKLCSLLKKVPDLSAGSCHFGAASFGYGGI